MLVTDVTTAALALTETLPTGLSHTPETHHFHILSCDPVHHSQSSELDMDVSL